MSGQMPVGSSAEDLVQVPLPDISELLDAYSPYFRYKSSQFAFNPCFSCSDRLAARKLQGGLSAVPCHRDSGPLQTPALPTSLDHVTSSRKPSLTSAKGLCAPSSIPAEGSQLSHKYLGFT